jgi:DNA polymerase-3 subunit delta
VEKIKLYYGKGCGVKLEDVTNIISRSVEDNNFKFIDAVISKNIRESFKMYDDLMRQKVEPNMLLVMLSKEYRNMLMVKKMGSSNKDLATLLGFKYDFQLDKTIKNSYNYDALQLEDYLVYLVDLDYKIKNSIINNKRALELFILYVCK